MGDEIVPRALGRRRLFQPGQSGNPAGRRRGLATKLCLERVLPRCHERPVTFSLPSLAAVGNDEIDEPLPQNVSRAMDAVTAALAGGEITPGEAATIGRVYETLCERPASPRRRSPAAICCTS
jgi:Family of unknown function (DUF5681)